MAKFAALPGLKDVDMQFSKSIDPQQAVIVPSISPLKNLRSLKVTCAPPNAFFMEYFKVHVVPVLIRSPNLSHFGAHFGGGSQSLPEHDYLECLAHEIGSWLKTSALKSLTLECFPIPFKSMLQPMQGSHSGFQNLRHLTLTFGQYPDWINNNSTITSYCVWTGLWEALCDVGSKHGSWLETLDTECRQSIPAMLALFKYLGSHPGLKALALGSPGHKIPRVTAPPIVLELDDLNLSLANQFWDQIVPQHAHSLKRLSVLSWEDSYWCYGPKASTSLRLCKSLEELIIAVGNVDRYWAREKAENILMISDVPGPWVWGSAEICPVCLHFLLVFTTL